MHISTENISETVTDVTNDVSAKTWSCIWSFGWHIYVWPWPALKVKVMYLSTEDISETVKEGANIASIANIYEVKYSLSLAYLHLT